MSASLDKIKETKEHHLVSNTAEILMMEAQLNMMKKMVHMEMDLKKNKEEFDQLCKEINQAQQKLKSKKRQRINEKVTQIHSRQEEREQRNKESNHILAKIKQDHRERRKRMESLVNEYKRQYDQVYQKKLRQRRQETRLNIQDISQHQKKYLRSLRKHSNRIKTESLQKSRYRYAMEQQSFELSIKAQKQENSFRREKIMELVNKRIDYGNKAQKQSTKIKIPQFLLQKLKAESNKSGYDKNIDAYNMEKQRYKKPKLDTNFNGDIQETRVKQINKIATEQSSPATAKLKRLRDIVDGYNQQYANGQVEALDMMCSASIARANLLLKQS